MSAFHGLSGEPITWEGTRIYPAGMAPFGTDVIIGHAQHWEADLIITLMDFWKLAPVARDLAECGIKVAAWLPVDCSPLSRADREMLSVTRATPIAMTYWGRERIINAGFPHAEYVPHAIDTAVFAPPEQRSALREQMGLGPDSFVVGINSANRDAVRKAWPEQFQGFKMFVDEYGQQADIRLAMHTVVNSPGGMPLLDMAADMGIVERIFWSDTYAQVAGLMSAEVMANWYGGCDVVSQATYAEGFGIPVLEAQACGTPVVVTEGTAAVEISAYSTLTARSEAFWNPVHRAWWRRPDAESIASALGHAYDTLRQSGDINTAERFRQRGRDFALDYDETVVADSFWRPVLDRIEAA